MNPVVEKLIPIFIVAFIGFLAGKLCILPENTSGALCSFLFYFCAPAVSFSNVISSDIREIFNFRFVAAMILFEMAVFLLLFLFYRKIFHVRPSDAVIHTICSSYGNISYVGIPVFLTLFDNAIPNTILILIHGMINIPLIIIMLDYFSGIRSKDGGIRAILNTLKNPNIFLPMVGVVLILLKIPVPKVLSDSAELLGRPTTSAGMFALGLTCAQTGSLRSSKRLIGMAFLSSFFKLVICPIIAFFIGKFLFRLDTWWLNSMVILAMLPAALNDFILSKRYHSDEEFASISVLMSTFLFSVTISLYILFIGL